MAQGCRQQIQTDSTFQRRRVGQFSLPFPSSSPSLFTRRDRARSLKIEFVRSDIFSQIIGEKASFEPLSNSSIPPQPLAERRRRRRGRRMVRETFVPPPFPTREEASTSHRRRHHTKQCRGCSKHARTVRWVSVTRGSSNDTAASSRPGQARPSRQPPSTRSGRRWFCLFF